MKLLLLFAILLLCSVSVFAAEGNFYEFVVSKDGNTLNVSDVVLKSGEVPVMINDFSDYRLALVDSKDNKLYEFGFTFDTGFSGEVFGETGSIAPAEGSASLSSVVLSVPYFPKGQRMLIYDNTGAKILEIPVAHFANLCNDGVCQDSESYESCQADCPSGGEDDYCDSVADGRCDVDCAGWKGKDSDCADEAGVEPAQSGSNFAFNTRMLVILGGVITAISGMVVLFARLRNRKEGKS
ncbi:hypothetical protein HYU12_00600 [Candidatus Woesearchaeota archaeon]|nr:hypothetical protein [Candidatus Woesearchaeota archaeon]